MRDLHPVGAVVVLALLGTGCLLWLRSVDWFRVAGPGSVVDGVVIAVVAAPVFAVVAIAADLVLRFPADTNVRLPDALAFYPSIGFAAEIALHVVPLALLVALFGRAGPSGSQLWVVLIPVILVEAGLQAAYATRPSLAVFSGIHLVLFGLVQLLVFREYGFIAMLTMRLSYYALWHVAWGWLRLQWLF
jgi:hypothetical protein